MQRRGPEAFDADGGGVTHDATGLRIGLAVSRFNREVTGKLLDGARRCLAEHGGTQELWTVVHVPGAWELQLAAARLARSGELDAVIALGALIKGETPHFEILAHQVARGLADVSLETSVPVIFGVLTTNDAGQALARAGDGPDNKGWEAALAAIEMIPRAHRTGTR